MIAGVTGALSGCDAILRLTDNTGMLQHSCFGIPDRAHGYCIDDNARALMLMAIADDIAELPRSRLANIYAAFVQDAWNEETNSFRNFMGYDRQWLERKGSTDSNGRALWALATVEAQSSDKALSRWAATLIDRTAGHFSQTDSPRTAAFYILAMDEIRQFRSDDGPVPELLSQSAEFLLGLYHHHSTAGWNWFEPYLSYDNYRLPEALIIAGLALNREDMADAGMSALSWLVERQIAENGLFRPVATEEFGVRHAKQALFDQQPIEAWAAIDASIAAARARPWQRWLDQGEPAYAWFTGSNDAGQCVADIETGECFDGINAAGINLNRGAESVLAWQFAQRRIKVLRMLDIS